MKINIYTKPVDKDIQLYQDFNVESTLIASVISNIDIDTYQMLFLYTLKSIVARKLVNITYIQLYIDNVEYKILPNGRLSTSPPIDLYEKFIDDVLGYNMPSLEGFVHESVQTRINVLYKKLYSNGFSMEKRINGYMLNGSGRKVRFMVTESKLDFYYEIVNSRDESFVTEQGSLLGKSDEYIIDSIMSHLTNIEL